MELEYWIQNADLSIAEEGEVKSLEHALSLLANHDWRAQLKLAEKLISQGDNDNCPAGIGLVRGKGIFLHLCPNGDGTVLSSCCLLVETKRLGLFKGKGIVLYEASAMPIAVARKAIGKFLAGDDDWVVNCFNEND